MSFGASPSDIILVTQLALRTVNNTRKACGEYDQLTRDVFNLHAVLSRLASEATKPGSPLNRPNDSSRKELQSIISGCNDVLKKLDLILREYDALGSEENSGRKLWAKFRFGNGQMAKIGRLRANLAHYTAAANLFLNMTTMGTMGRVEQHMNEAGGDLREIKLAVNGITAHLMASSNREGSVLSNYADDDKAVWKDFRRDLNLKGFSSSVIHRYKNVIQDYIEELANRGVLDDEAPPPYSPTVLHQPNTWQHDAKLHSQNRRTLSDQPCYDGNLGLGSILSEESAHAIPSKISAKTTPIVIPHPRPRSHSSSSSSSSSSSDSSPVTPNARWVSQHPKQPPPIQMPHRQLHRSPTSPQSAQQQFYHLPPAVPTHPRNLPFRHSHSFSQNCPPFVRPPSNYNHRRPSEPIMPLKWQPIPPRPRRIEDEDETNTSKNVKRGIFSGAAIAGILDLLQGLDAL